MLKNQHHFFTMYIWDATQRECKPNEIIFEEYRKMFESRISAGATEKNRVGKAHAKTGAWAYDVEGHAQKCVERYCELANKKLEQRYKVSSPFFFGRLSVQKRGIGISWRIVTSFPTNCVEMLVPGTNWLT